MSSATSSFPERIELSGEGLVLRDWTEADLAAMPELFDHPDIAYWTPIVSPFDAAAARARGWTGTGSCGRRVRPSCSPSPSTVAHRSVR
ncbi:hypothetical protein GCM10017687_49970 [Streptomyces echinatus]